MLHAAEYLQQRGLTRTVLTHKGNAVFIIDYESGVAKQGFHPKLHLQSFY